MRATGVHVRHPAEAGEAPPRAAGGGSDLRGTLRRVGLRATRPRMLVLQLLGEMGGHRSADEMAEALRLRGTRLPRTSVYNAMAALVAHGLVMVADVGPGRTLYERNDQWHHHFVCRRCGTIIDVPCMTGGKPCLVPPRPPGEVDEAQVIFRGRCQACLAAAGRRASGHRNG